MAGSESRHVDRGSYRGAVKNDAWLHTRAAAVNLRALINLGLGHTDGTWTLHQATG